MKLNVPDFEAARVLVVGDIMLDRYWEGGASRISPEAPVPVVKVEQVSDRPGGAGNVALNIASLGAQSILVGYTGDDEMADSLQDALAGAGVECAFTRLPNYRTITKLRVISRQQQLLRLDFEETDFAAAPQLNIDPSAQLDGCDAVVLSDYAKGALANPQPLIAAARFRDIPVLVDPKGPDFTRYRGATVLTPNLKELEAVVGPCDSEALLSEHGQCLIKELELEALLVTRSENGMTLLQADGPDLHLPARAREVFDVTGAGDTVVAVLAAAIAGGASISEAVALANLGAGIAVGHFGASSVSAYELRQAALDEQGSERGILSQEQLLAAVAQARLAGEKVVFTNGCFDILHAGHVRYLEEARRLGDRLIVAVNSDASVRRLKGKGRPVNPQERRMAVLAGLEAVDWVVSFAQDTPLELLRTVAPQVLVKGGDYQHKQEIVGWDVVEAYGGEVHLLGRVDELSTTAIVSQIRNESKR